MNPASRNDTGAAQDPRLLDVSMYEDHALHRIGVNEGEQERVIWALPKINLPSLMEEAGNNLPTQWKTNLDLYHGTT